MIYEHISADKICAKNHATVLDICSDYKYDFKTDDNMTYEIKSDKTSLITNFFY